MIRKYVRSPNSQKYYNKMHFKADQCYDMTLAQMDIGIFQKLHRNILMEFKKLIQNNLHNPIQNKINRHQSYHQLQHTAKESIINWYNKQFLCQNLNLASTEQYIGTYVLFCTSIVTFCSYCIIAFTQEQDHILITTPVYSTYISIIQSLNRKVTSSELIYHKSTANQMGNFSPNFQDLELKIKNDKVKMILLSHPHNPSGRVWNKSQIKLIVDICRKYGVIIVSDEILSDLYLQKSQNKPNMFYSLARQFQNYNKIIVLNSISKSFNYSSLQAGYGLVSDETMFRQLNYIMNDMYGEQLDGLGIAAIPACLSKQGRQWLLMITHIIKSNYNKLLNFRKWKAPQLQICELQAAYIVYIDFSSYFQTFKQLSSLMLINKIWVVCLESNYHASKVNCVEVRICIACEQQHFNLFLIALDRVISYSKQNKRIKAKL